MRNLRRVLFLTAFLSVSSSWSHAQTDRPTLVQGELTAPGAQPFHLVARIQHNHEPVATLDMLWLGPKHFRRTLEGSYNQVWVVNGERSVARSVPDYLPVSMRTLIDATLEPGNVLAAYRAGERSMTKANGRAFEDGRVCFVPTMCVAGPGGLRESISIAGHSVDFSDYRRFHETRIARKLTTPLAYGSSWSLDVLLLEDAPKDSEVLVSPNETNSTLPGAVILAAADLIASIDGPSDVIWPQTLDGAERGPAHFYVSFDSSGVVREVLPVDTANERTNESALNQIRRWKFRPVVTGGVAHPGEGLLSLTVDTRKYGPKEPLTDVQTRALAISTAEPDWTKVHLAKGNRYTVYAAIDADGHVIELLPTADDPPGESIPFFQAVQKWNFKPLLEDGQPRPYRALINFFGQ